MAFSEVKKHALQGYEFTLPGRVRVTASGDPASPVLKRFFEGYDRAFVLPDEREDLTGFETCLAMNRTHRHAMGRTHCELVGVLEDEDGVLLGGVNFLATRIARDGAPSAAVALNYIYVEEASRGRGLLRQALAAVRTLALTALDLDPDGASPALFIEQNDPLRLTSDEYAADTQHSGLDQVDRLAIWARVGARVVDFPYVQPALSADQHPDDGLIYAAIDYPDAAVDAGLLHDHLESFFNISVLKGEADPPGGAASSQIAALAARAAPVPLLDMAPALAWLRAGRSTEGFESFRDLAREAGG
jgi:GNAT superfamily N-acetyltransferase